MIAVNDIGGVSTIARPAKINQHSLLFLALDENMGRPGYKALLGCVSNIYIRYHIYL